MTTDAPKGKDDWQLAPWSVEEAGTIATTAIFDLKKRRCTSAQSNKHGEFVYLDSPDWVNVIAITKSQQVVLIEQFRHGTAAMTLEIPGGMVDEGEDASVAGLRELREETGYVGTAEMLGFVTPNPAIQNNRCTTILVRDAELEASVEFDASEEIAVRLVPLSDVSALIRRGAIHHAIVVAAFHLMMIAES